MNCLQFLLAGKRKKGKKIKASKNKRAAGERDIWGSWYQIRSCRSEGDKEDSVPASAMVLCSPSWGGELARLCLVYTGQELSFLVSKAPFVKIIYFHLVREHPADMLCVLWKENQI